MRNTPLISDVALNDLPDYLQGFGVDFRNVAQLGVNLFTKRNEPRKMGSTTLGGEPDTPQGTDFSHLLLNDYYLYAQVNMAEIPDEVRNSSWPKVGMLWVFFSVECDWEVDCIFDPRDSSQIVWQPNHHKGDAVEWKTFVTMPPEIREFSDAGIDFMEAYENWANQHFPFSSKLEYVQIGGHANPCQTWNKAAHHFMTMDDLPFGDCGAIYISYKDGKFDGWATCR